MREGCSWRRAFLYSGVIHLCVAICFALAVNQRPEADFVIDLDLNMEQGSGYAGGGSGNGIAAAPVPLPDSRQEAAEPDALPEPAAAAATPEPSPAPPVLPEPAAPAVAAAGAGHGDSGVAGAGAGTGTGDGRGYGEGKGYGEGSGYSGVMGTGSGAFDFHGFANAVDANKQYPYMAVKRNIQGTVIIKVALDARGNLISVNSGGEAADILKQAALQAVRAACPFPNASGLPISFTTTIRFVLNS